MSRLGTVYLRAIQAVGRRLDYGTNVFDRAWDVLVVLDGCRADLLQSVADDTDVFEEVTSMRSVGSSSSEWLENTFSGHPETGRTVMVTGNTWTDRYLHPDAFAALDEVWKYAWDEDRDTVPAWAVTDRAIAMAQAREPGRLVVHYMQPHHPFVADPIDGDEGLARTSDHSTTANPWAMLRQGEVTTDRVWSAYEATLRHVLSAVATLIQNVDGRVAITADHGNLFGEWGLYGHPMHTPVPALLEVPWAETTGEGTRSYDPTLEPPEHLPVERVYGTETRRDRLDALGYL
jgi:hypothetical protein